MLPIFLQDRTFPVEVEVVPDTGHMTYSAILGQNTMRKLGIGTLISRNKIIWGKILRSLISRNYWSKKQTKQYLDRLHIEESSQILEAFQSN